MADPGLTSLPPLAAWQAASLRATAFVEPEGPMTPTDWWENLVGLPPESINLRPKIGLEQLEGTYQGRKLTLQVQPDRVDWLFLPAVPEKSDDLPEAMPSAGSFPETLKPFQTLVLEWLKIAPPVTRLAFGATLFQPVEDRRAGYLHLAKYLPSVQLDPDTSDFSYQISRPRRSRSGVAELNINRLMKWSVSLVQQFGLSFERKARPKARYTAGESRCRLELDINTAPDFPGQLPPAELANIFQELVGLGEEIAAKGDIP